MSMNKVIIIGRLGSDPELRYTQSGQAVCNMSVATNERWSDKDGNQKERTEWHKVTVWGKQGENCEKYLSSGRQVAVEGRIQTRKWQDDSGSDRYSTEIVASNVTFLSGGDAPAASGGGGSKRSEPANFDHTFDDDDIPF